MNTRAQGLLVGGATALIALGAAGCGGSDDDGGGLNLEKVGLTMDAPEGWKEEIEDDSAQYTSPDQTVELTVSSPIAGREPAAVKKSLIDGLKTQLRQSSVEAQTNTKLGNLKAFAFQMTGVSAKGPKVVVGLVAASEFRTYAVTLLIGKPKGQATGNSVEEARKALRSVKISKPKT